MESLVDRVSIGVAASLVIAGLAVRRRLLTISGGAATVATGTVVFGAFQWAGGFPLLYFFLTSSSLSVFRASDKQRFHQIFDKSFTRDAWQVVANGGAATLCAVAAVAAADPLMWLAGCGGALAAANADTWATELGVLGKRTPRSIITGAPCRTGTSGAISLFGTLAGILGSLAVASAALLGVFLDSRHTEHPFSMFLIIAAAGVAGMMADSLGGAILQAKFRCKKCGILTEKDTHCGESTILTGGLQRIRNDHVNAICSTTGAVVSICFWMLL